MISLIIPTLNEATWIGRCLTAIPGGPTEREIVVVDGESHDGTPEIVLSTPGVRMITAPRGRAAQMNAGAAVARGTTYCFLHADTLLPAEALLSIEHALQDPRIVGGHFDVRFDNPAAIFQVVACFMNWRSRLTGISTGDQAIFVRRTSFDAIGGYPQIPLMEDVEFTRRLKRTGRLAALRAHVTTAARKWERDGVLRTILVMWTLRLLYLCGVGPDRLHRLYYGHPLFSHCPWPGREP